MAYLSSGCCSCDCCCDDCECWPSVTVDSTYVLTGNKRWLLRLDRSFGEVLLLSEITLIWSSFMYSTLSELCRFGVRTRELCAINWDAEPEKRKRVKNGINQMLMLMLLKNWIESRSHISVSKLSLSTSSSTMRMHQPHKTWILLGVVLHLPLWLYYDSKWKYTISAVLMTYKSQPARAVRSFNILYYVTFNTCPKNPSTLLNNQRKNPMLFTSNG